MASVAMKNMVVGLILLSVCSPPDVVVSLMHYSYNVLFFIICFGFT